MEDRDELRQRLDAHGYASFRNVNNAPALASIVDALGAPVPQYDGGLIWDVYQDENRQKAFNTKSKGSIGPHTEFFEFDGPPPKYLVLQCVTPARCGGGATLLADSRTILAYLSPVEMSNLRNLYFEYYSTELNANGRPTHVATHRPLEEGAEGEPPIFRFSTKYMGGLSFAGFAPLHQRIVDIFYTVARRIVWSSGDILVWDNRRCLHAREAFDDDKRHLKRVIIA